MGEVAVSDADSAHFSRAAEEAAKASREALDSARELLKRVQHLKGREGISLLEVKNRDLLAYIRDMGVLMAKMSVGESIDGAEAVQRAAKHRTVLERVRVMEKKMQSQIEKVCQAGQTGQKQTLRARPDQMQLDDGEDEEEEDEDKGEGEEAGRVRKYVPPKVMAVHYDEHETAREERKLEQLRKRALQSSLVQELRQQFSDAPEEITERRQSRKTQDKERTEYEEEFMMRTQIGKKDKAAKRKEQRENALDSLLKFGDYMAGDEDDMRRREAAKSGNDRGRKRSASRGGPKAKRGRGGGGRGGGGSGRGGGGRGGARGRGSSRGGRGRRH